MVCGQGERALLVVPGLVEAGRENGLHGPVPQGADDQSASAGGLQLDGIGGRPPRAPDPYRADGSDHPDTL